MRKTFVCIMGLCASLFLISSCGSSLSKYTPDAAGFAKIQDDLKSKFGDDAYYSGINIVHVTGNAPGSGITLNVSVTKDPASLSIFGS